MRSVFFVGAMFSVGLAPNVTLGQVIDFETLPGGAPVVDGMLIRDQYDVAPYWVRFDIVELPSSSGPRVAAVGPPRTAFYGPVVPNACSGESSTDDKPAPGEPVGCFFLTDNGVVDNNAFTLLVSYTIPVRQCGGSLLDVDGPEQWTISALDADTSSVLGQQIITSGDAGTGDGIAAVWALDLQQDIHFVRIEYSGSGQGIGLAFDNFSPASLPSADLSVIKSGPVGPVQVGENLVYGVTVSNSGPNAATHVVLEDALSAGVVFVSATPSQGSCSETNGTISCDLGTIESGELATVQIVGTLAAAVIVNAVTVAATELDSVSSNNLASWATPLQCESPSPAPETAPARLASRLEPNAPNPFRPATRIDFSLVDSGWAKLTIYDASGRLVKTLVDSAMGVGAHRSLWNGRDEAGQAVSSGVYFYRLKVNGEVIGTRKAVVLR